MSPCVAICHPQSSSQHSNADHAVGLRARPALLKCKAAPRCRQLTFQRIRQCVISDQCDLCGCLWRAERCEQVQSSSSFKSFLFLCEGHGSSSGEQTKNCLTWRTRSLLSKGGSFVLLSLFFSLSSGSSSGHTQPIAATGTMWHRDLLDPNPDAI